MLAYKLVLSHPNSLKIQTTISEWVGLSIQNMMSNFHGTVDFEVLELEAVWAKD